MLSACIFGLLNEIIESGAENKAQSFSTFRRSPYVLDIHIFRGAPELE
jgi:hypothetical protein